MEHPIEGIWIQEEMLYMSAEVQMSHTFYAIARRCGEGCDKKNKPYNYYAYDAFGNRIKVRDIITLPSSILYAIIKSDICLSLLGQGNTTKMRQKN